MAASGTDSIENSGDELLPKGIEESLSSESLEALGSDQKIRSRPDPAWLYQQCRKASGEETVKEAETAQKNRREEPLYKFYTGDRSKLNIFEKQTFQRWKSVMEFEKLKHPRRHRRRIILIQPLSWRSSHENYTHNGDSYGPREETRYSCTSISDTVLHYLQQFCTAFYTGMETRVCPKLDLSDIPHLTSRVHSATNRRQFLVDDIIEYLRKTILNRCYCVLGVTVVDLYPGPEWNFVLGQACFEKRCGVLSFGRYFNTDAMSVTAKTEVDVCEVEALVMLGNGQQEQRLHEEELKQIRNIYILMRGMSHELGHLFGLAHCHYFQCAMNESSSIAEAASQPLFLCPICLRKVVKVLKCDLAHRYAAMAEVIQTIKSAISKLPSETEDAPKDRIIKPSVSLTPGELLEQRIPDAVVSEETEKYGSKRNGGDTLEEEVVLVKNKGNLMKMKNTEDGAGVVIIELEKRSDIVSGSKQLAMLERAIGWLEQAQYSLGEFSQSRSHLVQRQKRLHSSTEPHNEGRPCSSTSTTPSSRTCSLFCC